MKWRPISELSDEQRDGRWWLFGSKNDPLTSLYSNQYKYLEKEGWANVDCVKDDVGTDGLPWHDYFLDQPLPDLPEPMKMEWRRFDDEMPPTNIQIIVFHKDDNRCYTADPGVYMNEAKDTYTHWMPIIPPENK